MLRFLQLFLFLIPSALGRDQGCALTLESSVLLWNRALTGWHFTSKKNALNYGLITILCSLAPGALNSPLFPFAVALDCIGSLTGTSLHAVVGICALVSCSLKVRPVCQCLLCNSVFCIRPLTLEKKISDKIMFASCCCSAVCAAFQVFGVSSRLRWKRKNSALVALMT